MSRLSPDSTFDGAVPDQAHKRVLSVWDLILYTIAAVDAQIAVSEIVCPDPDDVGPCLRRGNAYGYQTGRQQYQKLDSGRSWQAKRTLPTISRSIPS